MSDFMSPRGEKKAGGRPAMADELKRQTLTCRVAPETKHWLDTQKEQVGKGIGELVDLAVETLQKHPEEFPMDTTIEEASSDEPESN
jgi:hypothetical protein